MADELEELLAVHRAIRQSLPTTWNSFFARFGTLRPVQLAAIPPILKAENVLVTAPTAGGKTEAVVAPICEQLVREKWSGLSTVIVAPTRALVNDLFFRLVQPVQEIGIRLGRKTSDHAISMAGNEQLLITTPESLESMLTFSRERLRNLRAIVLDEIHLLDGSPRGDQLRLVLGRLAVFLQHMRAAEGGKCQRIALSATVSDPQRMAAADLGSQARIIQVPGQRDIEARVVRVPGDDQTRAQAAIDSAADIPDVRKILVFVNSRRQVDTAANHFQHGAFAKMPVYGHHGSLSRHERERVEEQFRQDTRAICVATMTLEVGIDIGDVDLVVCMDPPFSLSSFLQRIGRGCRRLQGKTRVICVARDVASEIIFEAFIHQARLGMPLGPKIPLRRSVLVQQILAYLRQVDKNRRTMRQFLQAFVSDAAPPVTADAVADVLTDMTRSNLLHLRNGVYMPAQDGWEFIESNRIFSNIAATPSEVDLVDADTGKSIASVRALDGEQSGLKIAGRSFHVLPGGSRSRRLVREGGEYADGPRYHARNLPYAFDAGASLANYFGIAVGDLPAIRARGNLVVMTFLGRLFNTALARTLDAMGVKATAGSFAVACAIPSPDAVVESFRNAVAKMGRENPLGDTQVESLVDLGPHLQQLGEQAVRTAREDWLDLRFWNVWAERLRTVSVLEPGTACYDAMLALSSR